MIDTLNRALIGDENSSEDMAKFIRAADAIRAAFDCARRHRPSLRHRRHAPARPYLLDRRRRRADRRRARRGRTITAEVEHMKDGADAAAAGVRLERSSLATMTMATRSLLRPEPADGIATTVAQKHKLAPAVKLALDQLCALIASDASEPAPASNPDIPVGVRVCSAVRGARTFTTHTPAASRTRGRKAFVRSVLRLQELHLIGLWGERHGWPDMPDMAGQNEKVR